MGQGAKPGAGWLPGASPPRPPGPAHPPPPPPPPRASPPPQPVPSARRPPPAARDGHARGPRRLCAAPAPAGRPAWRGGRRGAPPVAVRALLRREAGGLPAGARVLPGASPALRLRLLHRVLPAPGRGLRHDLCALRERPHLPAAPRRDPAAAGAVPGPGHLHARDHGHRAQRRGRRGRGGEPGGPALGVERAQQLREHPRARDLRHQELEGPLPARTLRRAGQAGPGADEGGRRPLQVLPAQLPQERAVPLQAVHGIPAWRDWGLLVRVPLERAEDRGVQGGHRGPQLRSVFPESKRSVTGSFSETFKRTVCSCSDTRAPCEGWRGAVYSTRYRF